MKYVFSIILLFFLVSVQAQFPVYYYQTANNKEGEALQSALHEIINNHSTLSYSALWAAFYSTDSKSNNRVWDIYSDVPGGTAQYEYVLGSNQCGNYSSEGDCYNREHTFPTSWFDNQSPMNTDLFQIYPTDGYVNQKRGNYPYGETNSPNWTSTNGSKVGQSSISAYNGIVFEPIDEYKGDLARTYFYMATRYYGQDAGWPGSPMVKGAQPQPWALDMLMQWHINDPVSPKEIARNDAIYALQGNRNPFIDHPEFAGYIWTDESPGDEHQLPDDPEQMQPPTHHVEDFSSSFIKLSWDDATGNVLPDGYLIFISDIGFDDIPVPAHGETFVYYPTAVAVDYGVRQHTFTGLRENTDYYFKIYSFTGNGANIRYKTDGTVPQIKLSTN